MRIRHSLKCDLVNLVIKYGLSMPVGILIGLAIYSNSR